MALQTSGAISMSQIKDEFGGAGSHSLSEYYPLAGLGVSGIPSSGAISFSSFHGKSKNVTTSVWTSSGYNNTVSNWVELPFGGPNQYYPSWPAYWIWGNYSSGHLPSGYRAGFYEAWTDGYRIEQLQSSTVWVDTSAYVNTATIASIST